MLPVAMIAASQTHGMSLRDLFGFIFGLGIVLCAGTGLICAAKGDREGSTFVDPADIASLARLRQDWGRAHRDRTARTHRGRDCALRSAPYLLIWLR